MTQGSTNNQKVALPVNATQFTSLQQKSSAAQLKNCDIVIGFDLGTSSTKVVLQSPYVGGRLSFPVSFEQFGHSSNRYLLPTILYCDSEGNCGLSQKANRSLCRDLKLALINYPDGLNNSSNRSQAVFTPKELATAYTALVLRCVRLWFLQTQAKIFSRYKLRWHLNIGIPSPGYGDDNKRRIYHELAVAAWRLSCYNGTITIQGARSAIASCRKNVNEPDIHSQDINVVPEVAAEVVGYARSVARDPGLHVLIDIGASTLDIASFILHEKDGNDCYKILTTDLRFLGAHICHIERINTIRQQLDGWLNQISLENDLVKPVPPVLEAYVPSHEALKLSSEREINKEFTIECQSVIHRTIMHLRKSRDPNSERWKSGLPIFLCGGGRHIDIYRKIINDLNTWWQNHMETRGFVMKDLPKPDNFSADGFDQDEYHRFAVAYGLSFPYDDIGELVLVPPDDNIKVDRSSKFNDDAYISKDKV